MRGCGRLIYGFTRRDTSDRGNGFLSATRSSRRGGRSRLIWQYILSRAVDAGGWVLAGLWFRLMLGLILGGAIGWAAWWRDSLSGSGALGAVAVGTAILSFGGWAWGVLLIAFFLSSSLLSRYRSLAKTRLAEKFEKGGRRDLGQVLANGGVGTLLALVHLPYPNPLLFAAFVGAIAAVNADTWATELGVLSTRKPRSLTTWQVVEPGTSGGVSLLGTLAAVAGALLIGLIAAVLSVLGVVRSMPLSGTNGPWDSVWLLLPALLGGVGGSFVDSLLGATAQAVYYSTLRGTETEKRIDADGSPNALLRGWRWLNNDLVNLISSAAGALIGVLTWMPLRHGVWALGFSML
jgi:uncharacterized protein (TIGR00297 family)